MSSGHIWLSYTSEAGNIPGIYDPKVTVIVIISVRFFAEIKCSFCVELILGVPVSFPLF